MIYDVVIIGAGMMGGMLARELSRYDLRICLLEKENDVACGASRANSGIIHGGYDPRPGTLKARLNAQGVPLLFEAAKELHVPCRNNGSMVCAFSKEEEAALHELYDQGLQNGIPGVSILTGEEARLLEPNLSPAVTAVLRIESAGIICPYELTIAAVGNAMDNGAVLLRNFPVSAILKEDGIFTVSSPDGQTVQGKYLCNCAGGYADKVAAMAGDSIPAIIPRAGEYLLLDKTLGGMVNHTLFQVPTKNGKGILVTPTVDGNLLCGPTAAVVDSPESRDTTADGLGVVQKLAAKSVPGIDFRQVITSFTGVRASCADGEFQIYESGTVPGLIHAAAIDSPGLSCCVSIAKYVTGLLEKAGLVLRRNPNFNPIRPAAHDFRHMSDEEKDAFIRKNPAYGKIVCRCETVSEGEILEAIRRNPPAYDVDGVKRRTRSGMGRCQGGFCGPYVMELLAKEHSLSLEAVTKSGAGSEMVMGRIGE